jgi:hypothetical protein
VEPRGTTDLDNAERIAEYVGRNLYWLNDVRLWVLHQDDVWGLYSVREQAPVVAIVFQLAKDLPALEGHHYDTRMLDSDAGPVPSEYESWHRSVVRRLSTYPGARRALGQLRGLLATSIPEFLALHPDAQVVSGGYASRKSVRFRGMEVIDRPANVPQT